MPGHRLLRYTATINGQTFQGTGSFTGSLYAKSGATDSVSESLRPK